MATEFSNLSRSDPVFTAFVVGNGLLVPTNIAGFIFQLFLLIAIVKTQTIDANVRLLMAHISWNGLVTSAGYLVLSVISLMGLQFQSWQLLYNTTTAHCGLLQSLLITAFQGYYLTFILLGVERLQALKNIHPEYNDSRVTPEVKKGLAVVWGVGILVTLLVVSSAYFDPNRRNRSFPGAHLSQYREPQLGPL